MSNQRSSNLAFSLQATYAAPLVLPAQTRQAERYKVQADADARHREDITMANDKRFALIKKHTVQLVESLQQNMQLTEINQQLSKRIERMPVD